MEARIKWRDCAAPPPRGRNQVGWLRAAVRETSPGQKLEIRGLNQDPLVTAKLALRAAQRDGIRITTRKVNGGLDVYRLK